jgi:hypothetical protein
MQKGIGVEKSTLGLVLLVVLSNSFAKTKISENKKSPSVEGLFATYFKS